MSPKFTRFSTLEECICSDVEPAARASPTGFGALSTIAHRNEATNRESASATMEIETGWNWN
jgi:hypothetical protein